MPPGATELSAVNELASVAVLNDSSDPAAESLLAKATSEGELTRVGTCDVLKIGGPEVRPVSESLGNTRYTSTTTWLMVGVAPPLGTIRPVKVPFVNEVRVPSRKSS